MSSERSSLLDEMRQGREEPSTAFMEFTSKRKYHKEYAFCFYECEDGKYYDNRIRNIIGNKSIHIRAGNKQKVLRVMKLIKSKKEYQYVNTMFFVDRDMEFNMEEYLESDLYVTPCYSIENLYVNEESFGMILETEFGLNIDDEDYKKYKIKFTELYDVFCDLMLEFNTLVFLRKEKKCTEVNIQDIETKNLINVNILDGVKKTIKYDAIINKIKQDINVIDEEIESAKERLLNYGKKSDIFRGKNQLYFIIKFLEQLCDKSKNKALFKEVPKCIRINPSLNTLSTLSSYAKTPPDLTDFIKKHCLVESAAIPC